MPSTCRLYLAVPCSIEAATLRDVVDAAAQPIDIAAVLLRLQQADPRTLTERIKVIAAVVQSRGAALLTDGHADLVARGGADGAQLTGIAALQEALPTLKPERIAGAGGLVTRHDAMLAGEAGADYVLFGEPNEDGAAPAVEAVADRIAWWAEVFEIPCVGYAVSIADAVVLANAGADFVLIEDAIWSDPKGAAAALMDARRAIGQGRAHAPNAESR